MLYDIYENRGSVEQLKSSRKSDAVHRFIQINLIQSAIKSEISASSRGSKGEIIKNMHGSMCVRVLTSSTCY